MRRLFRLIYSLGLRRPYASVDRLHYLRRLSRPKHCSDVWYYSDKDHAQRSTGEVLIRTSFRETPLLFSCETLSHVERRIIRDGLYTPRMLDLMADFIQSGSIVVDAGANIGAYTVPLARAFPEVEVHAFEPHPGALVRLKRNLAMNNIANAVVHPSGVGGSPGTLTFYARPGKDVGLSSFVRPREGAFEPLEVPVVKLDDLLGSGGRPVSVMKIDVQGFEAEVLEGARRTVTAHRPAIVFEHEDTNFADDSAARSARQRLRSFFSELGYAVYYMTRYDADMFFPVDWDRPLNGNVLALPMVPS